jgi:hypothetical protein
MSSQIVPLAAGGNQQFNVQLTVNGQTVNLAMALNYDAMAGWWTLGVTAADGTLLVSSVPLVTGLYPCSNLLAQYEYLQIGEAYLLNTGNAPTDYPGQNTLGLFSLLWSDNT